jgi:hypothetical protein
MLPVQSVANMPALHAACNATSTLVLREPPGAVRTSSSEDLGCAEVCIICSVKLGGAALHGVIRLCALPLLRKLSVVCCTCLFL